MSYHRAAQTTEQPKISNPPTHHHPEAFQPTKMPTKTRRESIEKDRISLAIDAFKRGQFKSIHAAVNAFDVSYRIMSAHLKEQTARDDTPANG